MVTPRYPTASCHEFHCSGCQAWGIAHPKILADSTAGKIKASEWLLEGNCPVDFLSQGWLAYLTGRGHAFSPGMGFGFAQYLYQQSHRAAG